MMLVNRQDFLGVLFKFVLRVSETYKLRKLWIYIDLLTPPTTTILFKY